MPGPELSVLVVDDFYARPHFVRSYALGLPYADAQTAQDWQYYKGRLSTPRHPFAAAGLDMIANVLNRTIVPAGEVGEFRLLYGPRESDEGGDTWVHTDVSVASYSAIVFLNTPEQCRGGLRFYRHRESGFDRMPHDHTPEADELLRRTGTTVDRWLSKVTEDGYDPEQFWDVVLSVEMVFNRCVIFDARLFHSRSERFGLHRGEARLTQNFFFHIPASS